jgi:hypothetical protein
MIMIVETVGEVEQGAGDAIRQVPSDKTIQDRKTNGDPE